MASLKGWKQALHYEIFEEGSTITDLFFLVLRMMAKINKVVLAYSGGLDTSVILKWLQETYAC